MYPRSVRARQADALFASPLQRSDQVNVAAIRQAVALARDAYGDTGCAQQVAQEFGDHPETAAARMRWARAAADALEDQPRLTARSGMPAPPAPAGAQRRSPASSASS